MSILKFIISIYHLEHPVIGGLPYQKKKKNNRGSYLMNNANIRCTGHQQNQKSAYLLGEG